MKNQQLGKFQVSKVANGFLLSVLNPNYKPGQSEAGNYVEVSYIAETLEGLANQLVAHLVTERLDKQQ